VAPPDGAQGAVAQPQFAPLKQLPVGLNWATDGYEALFAEFAFHERQVRIDDQQTATL
jgi:hypothetical protein